jgi:hypothetical protein
MRHCFQERIMGSFLVVAGVCPTGTPTMIGAIVEYSSDGAGRQHQVLRRQPAVGGYELAGRLGADDDEGTRSLPVLLLVALLL